MPVIEAQDIVNAVIQDSQNLTTNRTALYDYTDRIHQRILRESKWRFLLSDPQTFVTLPGVASYTLSGTAPAGSFQAMNLSNFNYIAPGTVFNLTTWAKMEEDADEQTTLNYINNRDGSLRAGNPRTYQNSLSNPGTLILKPVPDGQNQYYPVPETPYVQYVAQAQCTLPQRLYFGVVTFVDSLGGESTQCAIPFTIVVPAGNLLQVSSPQGPLIAGNQAAYSQWNVYVGSSTNNYVLQNAAPIAIGTSWLEPITGAQTGVITYPMTLAIPYNATLSVTTLGVITSTWYSEPLSATTMYALIDQYGQWWQIQVDSVTHQIETFIITPNTPGVIGVSAIYLADSGGISTWALTIVGGQLVSSKYATPALTIPTVVPPASTSIQPLAAYMIQFRYYQVRNQITSANPTQVLQIPYAYKDIVIAGVNYLANLYIDRADNREPSAKTLMWKKEFDTGLSQIRRDLRISYRKSDFIGPDTMSQYVVGNQQGIPTMGW